MTETGENPEVAQTATEKNVEMAKENAEHEPVAADPVPEVCKHRAVTVGSFGGSKHLRVDSLEEKIVGKKEVQIEVEACGVNFMDVMVRQGLIEQPLKPPFVMGSECAGIVTKVGEEVSKFKVGDRVVALLETGAWNECLTLPVEVEENEADGSSHVRNSILLPWPSKLSAAKASTLGFAYLPAYVLLHHVASIRSGDVVFVHSAAGGLGTAIGQIAKALPNVKLIGSAPSDQHEKLNTMYDALFRPDQDFITEIKRLHPKGIDIFLDCLGGEELTKSTELLKPLGKYIICGMLNLVTGDRKNFLNLAKQWLHVERINPLRLHEDNRVVGGFSLRSLLFPRHLTATTNQMQLITEVWTELSNMIESSLIDPVVDSEWRFDEVKEAMLRLQDRKNVGDPVLLPKLEPKEDEQTAAKSAEGENAEPTVKEEKT